MAPSSKENDDLSGKQQRKVQADGKEESTTSTQTQPDSRKSSLLIISFSIYVLGIALIIGYLIKESRQQQIESSSSAASISTAASRPADGNRVNYTLPKDGILLTKEELAQFDGRGDQIYLAILGEVYDVTSGMYYHKGGGYEMFAGRDGTRGFSTGEPSDDMESVHNLTDQALFGIVGWAAFYQKHENYTYVGRVVGKYYDAEGAPTPLKFSIIEVFQRQQKLLDEFEVEKKLEPNCGRTWERAQKRTEVFCNPDQLKNAKPNIKLVPRKKLNPATQLERCACVAYEVARHDPDKYKVYDGCSASATSCFL